MRLTAKEVSVVLFREYLLPRFKTNFLPHPIIKIICNSAFPKLRELYNQKQKYIINKAKYKKLYSTAHSNICMFSTPDYAFNVHRLKMM